jgi:hypothetical protein
LYFVHHPIASVAVLYLALVAVIIQINGGVILVAVAAILAPFSTYYLGSRTRKAIRAEAAAAVTAAEAAAESAAASQGEIKERVDEVHVLVNSQKDELERALAERDERIALLERLVASRPVADAGT